MQGHSEYSFVSTVVAWCSVFFFVCFFAIHTFTQSKEIKLRESEVGYKHTKPLVLFICKH